VRPREKSFTIKNGADLYQLSGERAAYENAYVVAEINAEPANEYIRFNNGRVLRLGDESGGMRDDVWRVQIKHTVKKHLEKELLLRQRGIKVLSLFFIDRVANYRDYDGAGQPVKGKFAEAFEAELAEFAKDLRYAPLEWLRGPSTSSTTAISPATSRKRGRPPYGRTRAATHRPTTRSTTSS
jgi:type III restriction enzyme